MSEEQWKELYGSMFMYLGRFTGIVVFRKKNNELRVMLCTRNDNTIKVQNEEYKCFELKGHDKRCNIQNGNMSVFDLVKTEPRGFNAARVMYVEYFLEEINTESKLNYAIEFFAKVEELVKKEYPENKIETEFVEVSTEKIKEIFNKVREGL